MDHHTLGGTLQVVGLALQLGGVVGGLIGIRQARLQYAPELPGVAGWFKARALSFRKAGKQRWQRLRHRYTVDAKLDVELRGLSALGTKGEVGFPPLARTSTDAYLAGLEQRTELLIGLHNGASGQVGDLAGRVAEQEGKLDQTAAELKEHSESQVARYVASGIRAGFWGLLVAGIGAAVATWGSLIY